MIIEGKHNKAKVMTTNIEQQAIDRVRNMTNLDYLKDTNIVMMPDVHEGKGCAIGTTIMFENKNDMKISPSYIGVDIGCGMSMYPLGRLDNIDLEKLDAYIHKNISVYPRTNEDTEVFFNSFSESESNDKDIQQVLLDNSTKKPLIFKDVGIRKLLNSIGTLGGGNHFIEIGKNSEDEYFLIVHTGSRFLGAAIEKHYQEKAINLLNKIDTRPIVNELKRQRKFEAIQPTVNLLKEFDMLSNYKDEDCYLWGKYLEDYIYDQNVAVDYAYTNRLFIINKILEFFNIEWDSKKHIDSPHNYIDKNVVRKGSCNAEKGKDVLIPINMRDGIIYGKGKGNKDWNYSAPHGAGRVLSRRKAKAQLDMDTFKEQMKDVYSSTVVEDTLDESPDAYKPMQEILDNIKDTVDVVDIIKPVYNFKGIEEKKWWEK
ncbi:RtcB family protein [Mammaliicoccus sciuri]|uniref:RtcB family protein n=1 Tax=Mammaliicoccus sciuri TaxID=1296 RepID=UPI0019D33B43|nr:RtcB family protein [Mammaliicoccus sciuri]QSN68475.1 RtcB family protein [Mammaliicoccus sciuri]UIU23216.1 RtcB family protein [Mammaliicoccus sciuri]UIU26121.1 RtcB family protein [Mammaliicoccus sciuri]